MIRIKISNHEEVAHASTGPFTRFFAKVLSAMSLLDMKRAVDKKVLSRLKDSLAEHGFDTKGTREVSAEDDGESYITLDIQNLEAVIAQKLEEGLHDAGVEASLEVVTLQHPPETIPDRSDVIEPTTERDAEEAD